MPPWRSSSGVDVAKTFRIDEVIRKKDAGFLAHALLYPLSIAYCAAVKARALLYNFNILPSHSLPRKVVSVGNITVGGTGKTPVVIFLAEFYRASGKKVAVLSRGYKGTKKGAAIVSDGRNLLLGPKEAGDEPYLIATRLKGVPVAVCADRVAGGKMLIERFSPDVIILDDAFQHIRLKRDVNIVLIDAAEGFGPGYMLPRGILREPVSALKRADFALIKNGPARGAQWEALQRYSVPSIEFHYRASMAYSIDSGEEAAIETLAGREAVAVSGIANPASFADTLASLGIKVSRSFAFPDHHAYSERDIRAIEESASGAVIITTEKDGVKLKGMFKNTKAYALRIEAEMDSAGFKNYFSPMLRGVW